MKKKNRFILLGLGLLAGVFVMSGCTANFVTEKEKARLYYIFEPGVSSFYVADDTENIPNSEDVTKKTLTDLNIVQVYTFKDGHFENNDFINDIIDSAKNVGTIIPDASYFQRMDELTLRAALTAEYGEEINSKVQSTNDIKIALENYGYLRYYKDKKSFKQYEENLTLLREELTVEKCPSLDFEKVYKNSLNNLVNTYKSFITTKSGYYGNFGDGKQIYMDAVTWGDAWNKGGHIIEGLIVYPVAWLVDTFANLFAHGNVANYTDGLPQILSLVLVTIIVRLFIFLVTIKSTLSQNKMTRLQPELAKIQQKYPNANTSQSEKQRLAEEQMRLYKKHGVNPLSSLLVLIVQFPVFIGVWGAMTGSAVLSTGTFLKLDLSQSIWECLKMGPKNHAGWWTALVLILLMSAGQFFSMKIPQWIQKARTKKVTRLAKNPAEKSQNRTANIVSYVMLFMIIFMGFTLPAAMGVYWFIGAIVSLLQTLIMNLITSKKTVR